MTGNRTSTRSIKKILLRTGAGILIFFVLLIIIIAIALNTVVTPKRITPILVDLSKEYINGEVNCESVDITFFSTFPDLGITLKQGSIITRTDQSNDSIVEHYPQDTLLVFGNFMVALNPLEYLLNNKVVLHKIEMKDADLYAFVNADGHVNWDILKTTASDEAEETTDTIRSSFQMPELNIKDIRLQNVRITYDDLQQDIFFMADSLGIRLSGNMSKENANLNLGLHTSGISASYQGQVFSRGVPFNIRTNLNMDRKNRVMTLERGMIKLGILQLKANGELKKNEMPETAEVNIDFTLDASSLSDLLDMVPESVSPVASQLIAQGKVESSGKIAGLLGRDQFPRFSLSVKLDDGLIRSKRNPDRPILEKAELDFQTILDLSGKQPSTLKLNKLVLETASSIKLNVQGDFNDILSKPALNFKAAADINLDRMSGYFTKESGMKMGGLIDFDLSVKCMLDDILKANFGKINVTGDMNIDNVIFEYFPEDLTFYASNAKMHFGSNTKDSIRDRVVESLLRGNITMDSLNLGWRSELAATAGKLSARFSTSEPKDTSSIAPTTTSARAENLSLFMGDSLQVRAFRTTASIRVAPGHENSTLPEISARLSLDTIRGRYARSGGKVNNASLNLKFSRLATRTRQFNRTTTVKADSIQASATNDSTSNRSSRMASMTRAQRDSLLASQLDPETNLSFRIESEEARDLLRKWDISGSFGCSELNMRTPYFPLPVRMEETEMKFTSNTLSLEKANMQIGSSALSLNGEVEGIRRALLANGKVSAKFALATDSIDFNQLIKAAVAGSEYMQRSGIEKDSISDILMNEANAIPIDVDTIESGIFVVPRNLDIEFTSRLRNARFTDFNIRRANGSIILRDQAIHLSRFTLNSDAGSAYMTMVYKAPDNNGAHVGLDLNMNQIDVKEIIHGFPMIDSLAPMLRSFEGVVDCQMTAVTELDSLMNILLPETTASCHLRGKNLVLLDGETFTEISKTLMFKNKKRNVIDSVSVEMILEDEKLMIFPFHVSVDRYNVAVGGIQNLDLSFDYHITVLKSPIPFKLGLNISGNPDKMKIRLGKAKYKNMFTVARQKDVDNSVINIRGQMDQKLRQTISEIAGMDISQSVRRPRTELPDSLRRVFFVPDTTAVMPEDTINISDHITPNTN